MRIHDFLPEQASVGTDKDEAREGMLPRETVSRQEEGHKEDNSRGERIERNHLDEGPMAHGHTQKGRGSGARTKIVTNISAQRKEAQDVLDTRRGQRRMGDHGAQSAKAER